MARQVLACFGEAWCVTARHVKAWGFMPKKRPPREIWQVKRRKAWTRDGGRCVHCGVDVTLRQCHTDHIQSGKRGTNEMDNLRTLCRRCHVLRADNRHRGMISSALRDGIIPPNWRELVWE